jgi:CheY-like chemotaxis protein
MAKILVADDEPKLGNVVTQMLQLDGHEVLRVGGGQEALKGLASGRFDVVVTDLRMPGTDGLAVLRAARGMASACELDGLRRKGTRRREASVSSNGSPPTSLRRAQA